MTRIIFWETECSYCGKKTLEEAGYAVIERRTFELILVCKKCYDDAPDDTWGIICLEWK